MKNFIHVSTSFNGALHKIMYVYLESMDINLTASIPQFKQPGMQPKIYQPQTHSYISTDIKSRVPNNKNYVMSVKTILLRKI